MKQVTIALLLAAILLLASGGSASAYEHKALIVVDDLPGGQAAPSQATLENLLGHFDLPCDVIELNAYQSGDIDGYRVTFYIGSIWNRELPTAFMADVMNTSNRVVWINYNIWQLEWSQYEQAFQDRFGFTFIQSRPTGPYGRVSFRDRTFSRPQHDFGQTQVLDVDKATTVASITDGSNSFPYIIRSGNFYYIADDPMFWSNNESDYLVFAEVLHDMVGIAHTSEHKALVRIEDIDPTEDPVRVRAIADYLNSEDVPFSLAVIPRFEDPLGAWGTPRSLELTDSPELVSALKYAQSKGGTLVLHGYTHQYGNVANPYNGVTGLDSEFYIQQLDGNGGVVNISPVPEDSVQWANSRIDSGIGILEAAGLGTPRIWETPHYLASDLDNRVFADRFGVVYQRFADCLFPYVVRRSIFGGRVIPENLGYIQPGVSEPPQLIDRADRNLAVRDGFASFFFHSELDIEYLQATVVGLKAKGYTFVGADSLIAAEPRDLTPPSINNVSPADTIHDDSATIAVSYTDPGDGIDLLAVTVALDGEPLSNCAIDATSASCPVAGLAAGMHTIGGLVADNAGNATIISGSFQAADITAPQVSYSGPLGVLKTAETTLTASYSDPGLSLGIDENSATVRLNGGAPLPCDAAGGSIQCLLTGLGDGTYTAIITIGDNAGNYGSAVGSFSIDTTAPVVTSPSPAGWVGATDLTITAQVQEANLHQYPAWLYLDDSDPLACTITGMMVSCPARGLSQGEHGFRIDVYDQALNRGSTAGLFAVDSVAPSVTINHPQGLVESNDVIIDADLADSGAGVDPASTQVELDGTAITCTASSSRLLCAASDLSNGHHELRVQATDEIGNAVSQTGTFQTLFCSGDAPSLQLTVGGPFWASYADYQQRLLAVDYFVSNPSGPDASNVTVAGSRNSNGVVLAGASVSGFSIPAGSRIYIIFKYQVPQGVSSFKAATFVTATDDCGNRFGYPDSWPASQGL